MHYILSPFWHFFYDSRLSLTYGFIVRRDITFVIFSPRFCLDYKILY
uniref:Uncharacterized protein n=1 Tax=Anopheles albimanus TaxID=7167 RepID=A0A182FZ43_ANOAL